MSSHAPTIAERNAEKTRQLGRAGPIAPVPYREGVDHVRRCTACGHITRFHWYDSGDPRFRGHPGTRWCQICTAFCRVERCTSKRGRSRAPAAPTAPADCRAVETDPPRVPSPPGPTQPPDKRATGGEPA